MFITIVYIYLQTDKHSLQPLKNVFTDKNYSCRIINYDLRFVIRV